MQNFALDSCANFFHIYGLLPAAWLAGPFVVGLVAYRARRQPSSVGVDGELVVLRHDRVGDLPVGALGAVLVNRVNLDHARA
jgi:hypothetical protein